MSNRPLEIERRLPVYLLFDCSGSMKGEPISAMEMGLQNLIEDLRQDPACIDSVWVSLIVFGSCVELLSPLTWIEDFDIPPLDASGTTPLGEAVELVSSQIHLEVRKISKSHKGDWKPVVFIFTDGEPTDDWEDAVKNFHRSGQAEIIACGAGPEADDNVLKQLGHHSIRLNDTQPGTLANFMKWVSVSVSKRSHSLGLSAENIEALPPPPKSSVIIV